MVKDGWRLKEIGNPYKKKLQQITLQTMKIQSFDKE